MGISFTHSAVQVTDYLAVAEHGARSLEQPKVSRSVSPDIVDSSEKTKQLKGWFEL